MGGFDIDMSEVATLARDLERAPIRAYDQIRKIVDRGALNVKNDMQAEAVGSGTKSFVKMAASISYDTAITADGFSAEVGPEIGKIQGSLGFIAYEGSATSAPRLPDPQLALDRESVKFTDALAEVLGRSVSDG